MDAGPPGLMGGHSFDPERGGSPGGWRAEGGHEDKLPFPILCFLWARRGQISLWLLALTLWDTF